MEMEQQPAFERPEGPTGPAFAAIVASGAAFAALGALTVLAEAFGGFADWLSFSDRVGALSGETLIASGVFFASWAGLALLWRRSDPSLRAVGVVTGLLVGAGLLGTFPPFFQLFGD